LSTDIDKSAKGRRLNGDSTQHVTENDTASDEEGHVRVEHSKPEHMMDLGMTWIEPENLPTEIQFERKLNMMGCDRGGADNQKMIFWGKNFGTCSNMDPCLRAAMPIQMAYYCPKYGRPSCGGKCLSLINGDCLSGNIRDKDGGTHNFRNDPKFWEREVDTWGFGSDKPRWPANFGGGSCAYDYSSLFKGQNQPGPAPVVTVRPPQVTIIKNPNPVPAPVPAPAPAPKPQEFTYKKEKLKTCEWLGGLPQDAIATICRTRTKAPAARSVCPRTCALTQISRSAEAQNKYLHRKKSKKTCDWLNKRGDKAQVCSKNKNARGNCPSVC